MKLNNRGKLAVMQIGVLLIGIIATTWMIGGVSGNQLSYPLPAKPASGGGITIDRTKMLNALNVEEKPTEYGNYNILNKLQTLDSKEDIIGVWRKSDGTFQLIQTTNPESIYTSKVNYLPVDKSVIEKMGLFKGSSKLSELLGLSKGTYWDAIATGLQWGGIAYAVAKFGGEMLGLDKKQADALATASFWGLSTGMGLNTLLKEGGAGHKWFMGMTKGKVDWLTPGRVSAIAGVAIGLYLFMKNNKEEKAETVSYTCVPWDAPSGGNDCEKCNSQELPCSEYQCRSLGQSCQLINSEDPVEARCVWVNRHDVNPPIIQPWEDALTKEHIYTPNTAVSPPDRGVKIEFTQSSDKCVKTFTPLSFGITTDEPSRCKIDYERKSKLEEMQFYFGDSSTFKYEHIQILNLPGPSAESNESVIIPSGGDFDLYVKCTDANGNENTADFVFSFCVDEGPDTTPPLIVSTSLMNNMPIAYNQTSVDISVYVNEPAECKWSHKDQSYDSMEQEMKCSTRVLEMNAQMLYECKTTLTGLKSRFENKFYFKCKDNPGKQDADRNANTESYDFTIIGTQPLVIDSVNPDGDKIKDSTDSVKVLFEAKTSAGYSEGKAYCYFSKTDKDSDYVLFDKTNSHQHEQELWFLSGSYTYYLKCVDLGGNSDKRIINFEVETDSSPPIVVRIYKEDSYLKIQTNEKAECVYDTQGCSYLFDDGISMTTTEETLHYTNWNPGINYYIKCRDEYSNQPSPDECNIVVKPLEI
ncbi:MAG: hypothetical protein ABH804_00435 [archaeon]